LFVFSFSKNLISFFYYGFGAVRYLQESYERGCFSLSLQGVLSRNESAPEEQKIRCDLRSMDFENNSELTLDNINIINPFIKINNRKISISFILLIFIIIFLIFIPYIKYRNFIFVTKKQRPALENNTNQEIILKEENLNQEEILKEKDTSQDQSFFFSKLRDRLKEFHNESGRSILEGGELSNP